MRRVAQAMEEKGASVEYIACSGDPDSWTRWCSRPEHRHCGRHRSSWLSNRRILWYLSLCHRLSVPAGRFISIKPVYLFHTGKIETGQQIRRNSKLSGQSINLFPIRMFIAQGQIVQHSSPAGML
ncbi:MAG: hypothetical protein ACLTYN_15015 [Dysosmobacter welbionis]